MNIFPGANAPSQKISKEAVETIPFSHACCPSFPSRGGASLEKVGWKRDRIDGQKVYLTILMSLLLRNGHQSAESGVDVSTPVHPVAPPLFPRGLSVNSAISEGVAPKPNVLFTFCI